MFNYLVKIWNFIKNKYWLKAALWINRLKNKTWIIIDLNNLDNLIVDNNVEKYLDKIWYYPVVWNKSILTPAVIINNKEFNKIIKDFDEFKDNKAVKNLIKFIENKYNYNFNDEILNKIYFKLKNCEWAKEDIILSFKINKFYLEDPENYKEFENEIFLKNKELVDWKCHICWNKKVYKDIDWWIWPYKFYTLDKKRFIFWISEKNKHKNFSICNECWENLIYWKYYFENVYIDLFWYEMLFFINFLKDDSNLEKLIFEEIFKNYEDNVIRGYKYIPLENLLKLENLWNYICLIDFISIDKKNSEIKIKYWMKDIVPSKLRKFLEMLEDEKKKDNFDYIHYKKYLWDEFLFLTENLIKWYEINEDYIIKLFFKYHKKYIEEKKLDYLSYNKTISNFKLLLLFLNKKWYLNNNSIKMKELSTSYIKKHIEENTILQDVDKMYMIVVGNLIKKVLKVQEENLSSKPFLYSIDFDNLTYEKVEKIIIKAIDKLTKYDKEDDVRTLIKDIMILSNYIEKKLNKDKIAFYILYGMYAI